LRARGIHGNRRRNSLEMKMESEAIWHSHPQILSGEPVFIGTRVPVRTLLDYVGSGDSLDSFLKDFPGVRRQQAEQFLEQVHTGKLAVQGRAPEAGSQA
jgi:uncharacterized protein (DUF433 family)